ncbi:SPASM domain-containing protein [bacterium]|nr:SPASM domain-containing protein [bacterium]
MNSSGIAEYDAHRDFTLKPFRSACYAGYTSMVFDSIGRVRMCCVNSEFILGDLRKDRLDDIWNGARLQLLRDALKRYDFSLGCAECELKILSGITKGSTSRTSQFIPDKYEGFAIDSTPPYWPKHLEFHLSNKCNLQCVTCSGEFSSVIRAKREKLPPYSPAYDDQFFEDLRKYLPHIEEAQFLGGEPFIIPEMYRVWDLLIESGLSPRCHITTNGTVFGPEIERILTSLPVSVNLSMDGITKQTFESLRVNAKLDRVIRNARRIRDIVVARGFDFGFNFTLSRMNWHEFVDFLLFAESEGVLVSVSNVYFPAEMSLFKWNIDNLEHVIDKLQSQLTIFASLLKRNRDLLERKIHELQFTLNQLQKEKEERISLINMFRDTVAGPETMWFSNARAREMLNGWSDRGSICEIQCDLDDVLTQCNVAESSVFAGAEIRGLRFDELIAFLFQMQGSKVVHISLVQDKSHIDRVFRIEGGNNPPIQMRVIMMPIFDSGGKLSGARAMFANRADSFVNV